MNAVNALTILQLLIELTTRTQALANLLRQAHTEGRDVTEQELLDLAGADDVARAAFQAAIDQAKAGG